MRLKYYKPEIYKDLKEMYFRHFQYLNISDDILKGNFPNNWLRMIKDLDTNYINFKKIVEDYNNCSEAKYEPQTNKLIEYNNKLIASDEIMDFISKEFNEETLKVMNILKQLSTQSYLVGGSIRDILKGETPHDFDFVTDVSYDILTKTFKENGFEVLEKGKQFLVLIIKSNGFVFEISNFRKDGTYTDGRRPESVQIGTIEEDAARRDFTINALYYNLYLKEIADPTGQGIDDLYTNKLRFIGKAKDRLNEDLLRVYRAYRFASKGFEMIPDTLRNVRRSFECAQKTVSTERVKNELEKMIGI